MIHLVNMPFTSLTHPNLALAVFKAQLAEIGLESQVFNLNLDFAQRIGRGGYESIAFFRGVETQISEWLFTKAAWGEDFGLPEEDFLNLCGEELETIPKIADKRAWLRKIRNEVVPVFLEDCFSMLKAQGELHVVGFSCTFFQTVASLALGRLIKARCPGVKVIYGGACFHGEMGDELMRKVPWIDAVSTGEADDIIIPLVESLLEDRPPAGLHGVLYRDSTGTVINGPKHVPVSAEVIQSLPDPDFDDFFADASRVGLDQDANWRIRLLIPFESSRGCWWGQKHHCRFCGLNAQGMDYRGKSGEKVFTMLHRLAERYPQAQRFQAADNILAVSYFRELIPQLQESPLPRGVEIFYSVKSNMTRQQIKAMADAKIMYVQPGIESLSTHILQLMDKGVTALQNLFFLKCCREYGITAYWNNLIRLPGEQQADYDQMAVWIPKLLHFRPPYGGAPKIECHRFSPYFMQSEQWTNGVRPQAWYAGLFPAEVIDLKRLAYYFDAEWKDVLGDPAYDAVITATLDWIRLWKEAPVLPQLKMRDQGECLEIVDTRRGENGLWQLEALESAIYRAMDAPVNLRTIHKTLTTAGFDCSEDTLQSILNTFVDSDLVLEENGYYFAIALAETTIDPHADLRRYGHSKPSINNQKPKHRTFA